MNLLINYYEQDDLIGVCYFLLSLVIIYQQGQFHASVLHYSFSHPCWLSVRNINGYIQC